MSEKKERPRALKELGELVDAGRPIIYIKTAEEERAALLLRQAAEVLFDTAPPIFSWTSTEGVVTADGSTAVAAADGPRAALDFVILHQGPGIFLFQDFHDPLMHSSEVVRRLRDVYSSSIDTGKYTIISSPIVHIPDELTRDVVLIELPLPDFDEIKEFVRSETGALTGGGITLDTNESTLNQIGRALQGLTLNEARHALRRAAASDLKIGTNSLPYLLEEKHLLVKKKTGVIEYIANPIALDQVGGAPILKKWLLERRKLFEMGDELSREIVPKGILLMGVSGCGKSLAVKSIGTCFNLPLYRINMIDIFSGRHGNPEATFVAACRTMEEMAPAVLWFDEIEMGITSKTDDAAGTLGRIFAFFLTWMQEKARGLFVAATANRIDLLPAELIRKGRFDEVFFVDLPNDDERIEICRIHLQKRGIDPEPLQIDRLLQLTKGWTGAEIEQCVVGAITRAQLADRTVESDDLINQTGKVVPLSQTMREQVEYIRTWAMDRAVRTAPRRVGG
jgi:SpoVK/Ycf46/Vps4 family AAA+-type ATPase